MCISTEATPSPKRVIIVADDLGVCSERNAGILRCLEEGVVTRTSIMANGAAAEEVRLSAVA